MSKLLMVVVICTVVVLLAETAQHAQARPGPLGLSHAEILLSSSSRQLLSAESLRSDPEGVNSSNKDAEELDSEEELDAVCIEHGTCDEKRFLMASVDYKTDGPNNPITDPPH